MKNANFDFYTVYQEHITDSAIISVTEISNLKRQQERVQNGLKTLQEAVETYQSSLSSLNYSLKFYVDSLELELRQLKYSVGHLKGPTGKAARDVFEKLFGRALTKIRDIKMLNGEIQRFQQLKQYLPDTILKINEWSEFIDLTVLCAEGYKRAIHVLNSDHPDLSTASAELAFFVGGYVVDKTVVPAIGRWLIDMTVSSGLYVTSARAMLAVAGSYAAIPSVIPVVAISLGTRALRSYIIAKYVVEPICEYVEGSIKPHIIAWFHPEDSPSHSNNLRDFLRTNNTKKIFMDLIVPQLIIPNNYGLQNQVTKTSSSANPAPVVSDENPIINAPVPVQAIPSIRIRHVSVPIQYTPSPNSRIFSDAKIYTNYQFPRPVNPMQTQMRFTQNSDGEINFEANLSSRINAQTQVGATASILDLGGSSRGFGLTTQAAYNLNSHNMTLGGGFGFSHRPNNNALELSGSIASNDVTLTATASTSRGLSIGVDATNLVGGGIAGALVAGGAGLVYGIKRLIEPKKIPFLHHDEHNNTGNNLEHPACADLEKMLKKMRKGDLSEKNRKQLILKVEECKKISELTVEAHELLNIMSFRLSNVDDNPIPRWYNDHNFQPDIEFYSSQYEDGIQSIENLWRGNKIKEARDECLKCCRKFSFEKVFNEIYSSLFDPQILQAHIFALLETKGPEEANAFFQEAFAYNKTAVKYECQNAFAEKKIQCGYFEDAQKTTKDTINSIKSLSPYALRLKERARYLSICAEISKPLTQQDVAYVIENLNHMPTISQANLSEQIINRYDRMRASLYGENAKIDDNDTISVQEKLILKYQNDMLIKNIVAHEYPIVMDQYSKNFENNLLFIRALELTIQLKDFDKLQEILTKELYDTPKSLTQNSDAIGEAERLKSTRDAVYYLGHQDDIAQRKFSIDAMSKILSNDELSNPVRAQCHYFLGNLLKIAKANKSQILENYQACFNLDPYHENNVLALADMYCEQQEFDMARAALQKFNNNMLNCSEEIQKMFTRVKIGAARLELFIIEVTTIVLDSLLHFLEHNRYINHKIARYAHYLHDITGVVSSIAKKLVEGKLRNLSGISQSMQIMHALLSLGEIGLQIRMLCAKHFKEPKDLKEWQQRMVDLQLRLQWAHLGVSALDFGMAYEGYKAGKFLVDKLAGSGMGVALSGAGLINHYYYQPKRDAGNAPTTILYMLSEDLVRKGDSTIIKLAVLGYTYSDQIQKYIPPEKIKSYLGIVIGAGAAGSDWILQQPDGTTLQAMKDMANYVWDALPQIDLSQINPYVAAGALIITVAGTVYYYSWPAWYKQNINNAKAHITLATKEKDPEKVAAHYTKAQTHINDVIKYYPDEPEAFYLAAQIIISDPADKWKTEALSICDKLLGIKPKSYKFKELRINTLFSTLANPDLPDAKRQENFDKIRQEAEWLITHKPREVAGWWSKMTIEEITGNFSAALIALNNMRGALNNMALKIDIPEAHKSLKETEERILGRMRHYVEQIIVHEQKRMHFFDQLLIEKRDQLYAHDDIVPVGRIVWQEEQAFLVQENGWIICTQDHKKPSPGHFIKENGKVFKIGVDGQFTQIENNLIKVKGFSDFLTQHFSPQVVSKFIEFTKNTHLSRELIIYAPQKADWMARFLSEINKWAEDAKELSEKYNMQFSHIIPQHLADELTEGFKNFHQQKEEILNNFAKNITDPERNRLYQSLHQLIDNQKKKTFETLDKYKKEMVVLRETGYQHSEFQQALDKGIVDIESHIDQHIIRSYNILWAKVATEVATYVVGLLQQTINDAWTSANRAQAQVPLPDWLYCLKEPTTAASLQPQGCKKLILNVVPRQANRLILENKSNTQQGQLRFIQRHSDTASGKIVMENASKKKFKLLF